MRKIVYFVAATLDGFIASPDSDHEMFLEGGDHGTWTLENLPETVPTHVRALVPGLADVANKRFDTVLMGRGTYERGQRDNLTSPYQHLRQYVLSGSLGAIDEPSVELISTDALEFARRIKQEPGMDIWLCGGGKLAAGLRPEIDELIIKLNPVVVGSGIPLFDSGYSPQRYDLVSSTAYDTGVTVLTYQRSAITTPGAAPQAAPTR